MPGIVGIIGPGVEAMRLRSGLSALRHFPQYVAANVTVAPGVECGQVWRDGNHSSRDWAQDRASNVTVMVCGSAFTASEPARRMTASSVLAAYLRSDELDLTALDGSYTLLVADPRRRTVRIASDRLGTLPLYYTAMDGFVCFAPEAKAVFAALGRTPELSKDGVISFLNCGYCLGKTTLFEGVSYLEPGSVLEIDVDSGRMNVQRYWRVAYSVAPELRGRRAAENALHEALLAAHSAVLRDAPNGFAVMLSGGWDSRGLLAYAKSVGLPPSTALTWGRTLDVPNSDASLATELAARFAVPFKFIAYESEQLVQNAASWAYLSELANDNGGWYAEGATTLADHYRMSADFALVGDECWGGHGQPRTEQDVRNANMPATLGLGVAECLTPSIREECRSRYEAQIDHVLAACTNEHPIDRRSFLYLHGRVARFIFSLGYYKELAVEIRRPFLMAGVLDVLTRIPQRFRVDKNLYVSMLGRYFPQLAGVTTNVASSLPDWKREMRTKPALREFFLERLDESRLGGVLGELLDRRAVENLKRSFFSANVTTAAPPHERSIGRHLPLRFKQRLKATGLYPGSRNVLGAYPLRGPGDLVRCIALLSLLQESLGAFGGAAQPTDHLARATHG